MGPINLCYNCRLQQSYIVIAAARVRVTGPCFHCGRCSFYRYFSHDIRPGPAVYQLPNGTARGIIAKHDNAGGAGDS